MVLTKKILCVNTKSPIKLDWKMKPKTKSIIQKNVIKRMRVKMKKKGIKIIILEG